MLNTYNYNVSNRLQQAEYKMPRYSKRLENLTNFSLLHKWAWQITHWILLHTSTT